VTGSVRRRRAALAAVSIVVVAAGALSAPGCGDDEPFDDAAPPATRLTAEERRAVDVYERQIQAHCNRVARSLVEPGAGPSRRQEERAFAAADALVALAAEKPTAPVGPGQDLRLFVSDVTENLEGSNCDPRMIARLEEGLGGIPPS
jgi:hypothetical protein